MAPPPRPAPPPKPAPPPPRPPATPPAQKPPAQKPPAQKPPAAEPSVSELSLSGMDSLVGDESLPAKQDASLLLSEDAIKQLKEVATVPAQMDDSGLVLSDAAIMQLGRASVSPTASKKPAADDGPQVLSPSGILRMAAGLRLPDEVEPTRADPATSESIAEKMKTIEAPMSLPMRGPSREAAREPAPKPQRPAAAPVPVGISNLPTTLLAPISMQPPEDRTSVDVRPAGARKGADELAETAIRPVPGQISVQRPAPLPEGAVPLVHRPTSTGMVIVPTGGVLGGDIELPPDEEEVPSEIKSMDRKALVTRKTDSPSQLPTHMPAHSPTHMADPSLGNKPTQAIMPVPGQPPHEETAIRPVFARFGQSQDPRDKMHAPMPMPAPSVMPTVTADIGGERRKGGSFSLKLLLGLLVLGGIGAGGWYGTNWYLRDQQVRQMASSARSAYDAAFEHGRLADFVTAEAQLRVLSEANETDEAARQARALVLNTVRFEFGGGPQLANGSEWEQESLGAIRMIESERSAVAQAALVLGALAQGELQPAEQHLELLQSANTGEGRYRLPNGMVDYLASQVALLSGKEEPAVLALQRAVQKQRLAMWQRRLGYLLLRSGRDEEAIVALTAAQKRQEDLVGAQLDLAYARGRSGKQQALTEAKQTLQGLIDGPRSGADAAGKLEHARAAMFLADLTLRADPGARTAARELLTKAQSKAPATDVLFQEDLAQARLRIGDGEAAAALVREIVNRLPQRRSTRILLAQALVSAKQGNEALTALAPLTDAKEKGDKNIDAEAQLLRAQALLMTRDTLAAQQVARQVIAATPATSPHHIGAQLLTCELFLKLGEPVSARRAIEPLMKLIDKDKSDKGTSSGESGGKSEGGERVSAQQKVLTQLLWARTLLSMKPPQQSEARALLESVVAQSPDNADARYLLGRLLRELGVWAQAEQQLTAAVNADDRLGSARRELAGLLMLRGDFGKAREMYGALVKDEQDAELLISAARAERLDGAPEKALATLLNVRRQTGEISSKFDEELLAERARSLLLVGRPSEVVNLLGGPTSDISLLKKSMLPALLIRAHVSLAEGSQQKPELSQARALYGKLPKTAQTDADVRLAEAELLIAEGKRSDANQVLNALVASLQNVVPTSNGEDTALRQQAQKLLDNKK